MMPASVQSRGYTLVEVLIIATIMAIAGTLVIPVIGSTDVLRSQAAVRTVVADIMYAQSDAIAAQEPRAVVFDLANNTYTLVAVPGAAVDVANNVLYDPFADGDNYIVNLNNGDFGGATMSVVNFDSNDTAILLFDEFGAPIRAPGSPDPTTGGYVYIEDTDFWFYITVEGMTGQVWTQRVAK